MNKTIKIAIAAVVFALILGAILLTISVSAATPCQARYVVKPRDTLRLISAKYKVDIWYIVKANRRQTERPNYPIYAWTTLCIPYPEGAIKSVPAYVPDQPAGEFLFVQYGKKLTIYTNNFARNSNWWVKDGRDKLGKIKVTKKGLWVKTINADPKLDRICLKNQRTDILLCGKVRQIR